MRKFAFLLLLFFLGAAFADNSFFYYNTASYTINAIGSVNYQPTGISPEIQDLAFQSRFVPESGNVSVISKNAGDVKLTGDRYFYINQSSMSSDINYDVSLEYHAFAPLYWLSYLEPLNQVNYSSDMQQYLAFDNYVNPSPEMKAFASSLVSGLKYKAEAVLKIASFVHNYITYNLSVGGSQIYDAQWVYANKVGTCDEYSILTAALLRSIGIPTRFVHGYVKADQLGGYGAHSYVEVYLSGMWIPVDPTWGQYGFVDVSHIAFLKSPSPVFLMSSVSYRQRDASVSAQNPTVSFQMTGHTDQNPVFDIQGSFDRSVYYNNDYAVLTLNITTNHTGSVMLPLWVTTTSTLKPVNQTDYVLVTNGFKALRLVFKTPTVQYPGVIHPVIVSTPYSNILRLNVTNIPGTPLTSFNDIKKYLTDDSLVDNPHVSVGFNYSSKFYGYNTTVNVTLLNDGNTLLNSLKVTSSFQGFSFNVPPLGINQQYTVSVPMNFSSQGTHDEIVSVYSNNTLSKAYSFSVLNSEIPKISLGASYNVSGDNYNVTVFVYKNVKAQASIVNVSSGNFQQSVNVDSSYSFLIPIKDAAPSALMHLTFVDTLGNEHSYNFILDFNLSLWQKIVYYITHLTKLLFYS